MFNQTTPGPSLFFKEGNTEGGCSLIFKEGNTEGIIINSGYRSPQLNRKNCFLLRPDLHRGHAEMLTDVFPEKRCVRETGYVANLLYAVVALL